MDLKEQRLELSSSGTMSILCKQTVKMENSTRKLIVNMEISTRKQIVNMENSTRTSNYQRTINTLSMTYDSGGLKLRQSNSNLICKEKLVNPNY